MVTPKIIMISQKTRKIKKRIFAIEAAPAAMPVKPSTPAIIAIIRKRNDQRNIEFSFWLWKDFHNAKLSALRDKTLHNCEEEFHYSHICIRNKRGCLSVSTKRKVTKRIVRFNRSVWNRHALSLSVNDANTLAQLVFVLSEFYVHVALPHEYAMLLYLLRQSREDIISYPTT